MITTTGYPTAAEATLDGQLAPTTLAVSRKRVLHLVGSRQDEFIHDLSVIYAKACDDCLELDRKKYDFCFAHVHLDGSWSFPANLTKEALGKAETMPLAAAISHITDVIKPEVMVPHMFCSEGMTRYRSLFDLLQIPFLGNQDYSVWPSTDKATTKQILGSAGVGVPQGDLLVKGKVERPTIAKLPFVVKACNEDNSRGLSLVRREEDVAAAIEYAFSFDSRVVVEEYIAGREIRAAVVEEEDGSLTVLPKIEYFLEDIRTAQHKLVTGSDGKLSEDAIKQAKKDGDRQCPADLSPEIHARVDEAVKKAHRTLKCRHYSLFDIRLNEEGFPKILEACLFCSFSPLSVIPAMAAHAGREDLRHPNFFHSLLERVTKEHGEVHRQRQISKDSTTTVGSGSQSTNSA
jgi:D-alanine-D-alanine ligase